MKDKIITLKIFTDPGHGWLALPSQFVYTLGIADLISRYSYRGKSHVYLEEDCDAPIAISRLLQEGYKVKFETVYEEDTPIRRMPRFDPIFYQDPNAGL